MSCRNLLLLNLFLFAVLPAFAQRMPTEWEDYASETYYYSVQHTVNREGRSETDFLDYLLGQARAEVARQIKINVRDDAELKKESVDGKTTVTYSASSNFTTDVTLRYVETRTSYNKRTREGYAIAFLSKRDLADIYSARADKIRAMLDIARKAEDERKYGDALKYDYWALLLNYTLPESLQPQYQGQPVQLWARTRMEDILTGIQFRYLGRVEEDPLLGKFEVTFDGIPVSTLDFRSSDGLGESPVQQVRDGLGTIEFRANLDIRNLDIAVEYAYEEESNADPEMKLALAEVSRIRFPDAYKHGISVREPVVSVIGKKKSRRESPSSPASAGEKLAGTVNAGFSRMVAMEVPDSTVYIKKINVILAAIQNKGNQEKAAACDSLLSPEGREVFEKLIRYGQARVLGSGPVKCVAFDGYVYCRSIPMRFSFRNNYKSFLENVVFVFDANGKVCDLTFALEADSVQDILSKTKWDDPAKMVLINFLESYKTAFALENLPYLESVFSEDALIITGKRIRQTAIENGIRLTGEAFEYNRMTKTQYMSHLRRSFASKEYINLKFSNISVLKTTRGPNPNFYGIQVRQDYFSSNYGDSGYLYLLVDISNAQKPMIHVRTWQPEPDPEFGIYGIDIL